MNDKFYIIKDIKIEKFPFSTNKFLRERGYCDILSIKKKYNEMNSDVYFDLYLEKERTKLYKFKYKDDYKTEIYEFAISNDADKKFPMFKILKSAISSNEKLKKDNSHLRRNMEHLEQEYNILEFELKSYRNNKIIKLLKFLKIIK